MKQKIQKSLFLMALFLVAIFCQGDSIVLNSKVSAGSMSYVLYIGDTRVQPSNETDIFGDGKARYDSSTHTLTLSGVDVTTAKVPESDLTLPAYGIYFEQDLNIVLSEDTTNKITVPQSGTVGLGDNYIYNNGNVRHLNISGKGNLEINAGEKGILCEDITINSSPAISVNSGKYSVFVNNFTINDGVINLSANGQQSSAINSDWDCVFTVNGGVTTCNADGEYVIDSRTIEMNRGKLYVNASGDDCCAINSYDNSVTGGEMYISSQNAGWRILDSGKINMSGGIVEGRTTKPGVLLSGASFHLNDYEEPLITVSDNFDGNNAQVYILNADDKVFRGSSYLTTMKFFRIEPWYAEVEIPYTIRTIKGGTFDFNQPLTFDLYIVNGNDNLYLIKREGQDLTVDSFGDHKSSYFLRVVGRQNAMNLIQNGVVIRQRDYQDYRNAGWNLSDEEYLLNFNVDEDTNSSKPYTISLHSGELYVPKDEMIFTNILLGGKSEMEILDTGDKQNLVVSMTIIAVSFAVMVVLIKMNSKRKQAN